ncbi:diguanylate cyclase [Methylobacterium sp. ID0610]|uniref:diguanylate cyclase n=1 Tax=Methylobacterium carpenticola TaxID=3344827 RepID=UPI0036997DAF
MPPRPSSSPTADHAQDHGGSERARGRVLAVRLMRVMFGCYLVVAVALTAVQMAVEYRFASQRLTDDVAALQRTFSPGIEDAMWRFNTEVLTGILTGMKEIPVVVGVEIRNERGTRVQAIGTISDAAGQAWHVGARGDLTAATHDFGTPFSRTFDLVHVDQNGVRYPVGSWTVYSNDSIAINQVKNTLIIILINSTIKSLMLWLIFSFVIGRMIGRPLARISTFMRELDAENLGTQPLVIEAEGRHELHALATTLNTMVHRLRRAFEDNAALLNDLREMNATLQSRVSERTRELEVLAKTDLLTGLFNRRKLDEALDAEIARSCRERSTVSVIVGDVDHFKSINDRHGHKAGDAVLVAFAEVLRAGGRPGDTLGRWGGEEFMLICPGTDLATAAGLAEGLRRRIETTALPIVGMRTCSFGVAAWQEGEGADALVTRADTALYRSKRNGRNRVETSPPSPRGDGTQDAA